MKVLAIGAHPDDVELGCGATLARHVIDGDAVFILAIATGRDVAQAEAASEAARTLGATLYGRWDYPDQKLDTVPRLELTQRIERAILDVEADVVFTHFPYDRNLDHRIVADAVLTACRPCRPVKAGRGITGVLFFEVPSSTEWGLSPFMPSLYVSVAGQPIERKMSALACYWGEMRDFPHPRSVQVLQARALLRGAEAGLSVAEAFVPHRIVR